jgi:hypothetical protein
MFQSGYFKGFFWCAALMMSACTHRPITPSPTPPTITEVAPAKAAQTAHYTVLEFEEGKIHLSASEQEKIKTLARTAQKYGRPVSEVRVLAWPDHLELKEPKLAAQRASKVRSLVKADLKYPVAIEVYDMSADPEKFNDLINEKDPKKRTTFENTETISFGKGPKSSLAGNKASKAIVMVRYE